MTFRIIHFKVLSEKTHVYQSQRYFCATGFLTAIFGNLISLDRKNLHNLINLASVVCSFPNLLFKKAQTSAT
jgi:hypothetical protein